MRFIQHLGYIGHFLLDPLIPNFCPVGGCSLTQSNSRDIVPINDTYLSELGLDRNNSTIGQGLQLGVNEGLEEDTGGGGGRGHKGKKDLCNRLANREVFVYF